MAHKMINIHEMMTANCSCRCSWRLFSARVINVTNLDIWPRHFKAVNTTWIESALGKLFTDPQTDYLHFIGCTW